MKVEEFAARNGVSPRRVRAMIASGAVRAERVGQAWNVLDEARPAASVRRPLSSNSREALLHVLNERTLDGVTGQLRARTAARVNLLRTTDDPAALLVDWWRGTTPASVQTDAAANLVLHAQKGNSDRVREVLRRKPERYLRRPEDLARAVRDERTIHQLSVDELAKKAGLPTEAVRRIEHTGTSESVAATRRILGALQITPTAVPAPAAEAVPVSR